MPRCSIVIPVYNRAVLTAQCLGLLPPREDTEVIVVDDGSRDWTRSLLAAHTPGIRVVTHGKNAGFAHSCNDGAAVAAGEYLVFLNNDTLPRTGWLDALVAHADAHPAAAVVGAKLLFPNNTIQHAGVAICQDGYPRHIYAGFPANHPAVARSRRFQVVTGACMLVRRRIFAEAGGFDPAYTNGFEDVDLCLRLGLAGHEIHYCCDSLVEHLESVSPGRHARDQHNIALYRERWMGRVQPDDLRYYIEDNLLRIHYEGRYPVGIEASPDLALPGSDSSTGGVEAQLRDRSREVADLLRENVKLRAELGRRSPDSEVLAYDRLRRELQLLVGERVPEGASVLVATKGDGALLRLGRRIGGHFPQGPGGVYSGYHPADSEAAIRHLEELRMGGARYLVVPETMLWWLDHYQGLALHLLRTATVAARAPGVGIIYELSGSPASGTIRTDGFRERISDPTTETVTPPTNHVRQARES
jgi:GT2 family glycosyltransferase